LNKKVAMSIVEGQVTKGYNLHEAWDGFMEMWYTDGDITESQYGTWTNPYQENQTNN
jgi:hypothetical protein